MFLDTTSKVLQVILASAKTTNDCEITADYIDTQDGATFAPGNSLVASNGTSAVSVVAAPAASTQRKISAFTFYNADTVNTTVTVRIYDGTNTWRVRTTSLTPGQSLVYTPEFGWSVMQSTIGQIPATATNDNAAAGNVGEFTSATLGSGTPVSLTTNTPEDILSLNLSAGDWEIWGSIGTVAGVSTTITNYFLWINSISATPPSSPNGTFTGALGLTFAAGGGFIYPIGLTRLSFASAGNAYVSMQAAFTGGTLGGYGYISARRAR